MSLFLDLLSIGLEASADDNLIRLELHYRGFQADDIECFMRGLGWGRDRKEFTNKAKDWRRERFLSMRK